MAESPSYSISANPAPILTARGRASSEFHPVLALAYQYQFNNFEPDAKELQEKTFVEAEKAVALDPDLADAYIARGRMLWTHVSRFLHEDAIREYRHALSLNPNSDEALSRSM